MLATTNMSLHVGTVAKHPANPLFEEDRPWEQRLDNCYGNIVFDPDERLYRCWYSPFIEAPSAKNKTLQERQQIPYEGYPKQEMGVCYAESSDGITWHKPDLGLVEYAGSTANNLVMRGPHGVGVLDDPAATSAAQRYKAIYWGLHVRYSADGLHWSPQQKINCDLAGDTHNNALWVPGLNKYVAFTRDWRKTDRHIEGEESKTRHSWKRLVSRIESSDFINWSQSQVVIELEDWELQPYSMAVFEYAGVYLGLLAVHDQISDRVWTELTFSADSVSWQRIDAGNALIGCSDIELDYDYGCVYACAGPVVLDDEIRLYYGGSDYLHFGWRNGCLALATLRPDGFAGYQQTDANEIGTLTTVALAYAGEALKVTADVDAGGMLLVEVLDASTHAVLANQQLGETATDALALQAGAVNANAIQLRFSARAAKVYSFVLDKSSVNAGT